MDAATGQRRHLFTGASASVKGYAPSAPFAMGKFAMRALAQSVARELSPQNIHVAHFVIDGVVRRSGRSEASGSADNELDPDAIAQRTSPSSTSRAAPKRGRSSCAPRWSGSEATARWHRRHAERITSRASVGPFQEDVSWAISMRVTAAANALSSP